MAHKIKQLFSAEQIAQANKRLAHEIQKSAPHELLIVAILKGSFVFAADLLRALYQEGLSPEVEFMMLSSYSEGIVSQAMLKLSMTLKAP